jgi:16S rRNA (cytosine967-C5)-methyltransferase
MTPGARVQAAIDILSNIARTHAPADRVVDGWARASRYAGSKDRMAVSELVYSALRHRAELSDALKSSEPRLLALGALALIEGRGSEAAISLADGGAHAPAPLSEAEQNTLRNAALPDKSAQPWIRLNYPDWLHGELVEAFGDRLEVEMAAMIGRAPTDLRINVLKGSREKTLERLSGENVGAEPTPHSPWGLRLTTRSNLPALQSFRDGLFEVQDEGSQLACLITNARPGEQVLDLCAGGGGKTLALASMMKNRGQIYASDVEPRRLANLQPRAKRAGIRNVQTLALSPWQEGEADPSLALLAEKMDRVLIDAPCSGSGAWRRNPDARWNLTQEHLAQYHRAQIETLSRAALAVKRGGHLVYVTCSLLPSENERQIENVLSTHPGFELENWEASLDYVPPALKPGGTVRLSPTSTNTDGFFVAVLRRLE